MSVVDPEALLRSLCSEPHEQEWLEFKSNHFDEEYIGKCVSALANSAILHDQPQAFLVYGIEDGTHKIVGTNVGFKTKKIGNELFANWLTRKLDPHITLDFLQFMVDGKSVEIIVVDPAYQRPVRFEAVSYVRILSVIQKLADYPEREKTLWAAVSRYSFEQAIAVSNIKPDEILDKFYCRELILALRNPASSPESMIEKLLTEKLIYDNRQGGYDITNLLAIVAAKNLKTIPSVKDKSLRIIEYIGKSNLVGKTDQQAARGFVVGFQGALKYIMNKLVIGESIKGGKRIIEHFYPELSVREILANALIHQDLTRSGQRPTVEIYEHKIVITNPGAPLIDIRRFIDAPARSRNEHLASLMRRIGLCEERGSGIDRALQAIEDYQMPPPLFQMVSDSTVITLFKKSTFSDLDRAARIRACYQHACLRHQISDPMGNGTLRIRFGVSDAQSTLISAVIRDTIDEGLIKPVDVDQANRNARYLPYYA